MRVKSGFSTRIAAIFGGMFILAMAALFAFSYYGLPHIGLAGARQQKLDEALHLLEVSAGHRIAAMSNALRERRGDILVVAENKRLFEELARPEAARQQMQDDLERLFERLQRAYPDRYRHLLLVHPESGEIMASSRIQEGGQAFPDRSLIRRAARPGAVEMVEQAEDAGASTLVIVRQIRRLDPDGLPSGAPLAILVAFIDPRHLLGDIASLDEGGLGHSAAIALFDHQGRILARYPAAGPDLGDFRLPESLPRGFEGSLIQTDAAGRPQLAVYRHLAYDAARGWTLVHYHAVDEVLAELQDETRKLALTGLAFTIATLLLIALAARRITRPLRLLAAATNRLGAGELSVRLRLEPGQPDDEISGLSRAFNGMADHIERAYQNLEAEVSARTLELQQERDRAQRYLDIAGVMLMALDAEGRISMVNKMGEMLLGYPAATLVGMDWFDNFVPAHEREAVRAVFQALMSGDTRFVEYHENLIVTASGQTRLMAWRNSLLHDPAGRVAGVLSSAEDVTERRAAEEEIQNLAFYDPLTKLPNRRLLLDRLQQSMAASDRSKKHLALLFLDLDNFKTLNDTLGHAVGDQLLIEVARRLVASVRKGDTVSRLGGDEFVVLLEQLSGDLDEAAVQAEAVGETIITRIGEPYELATQRYRGTTSIGITLVCGRETAVDELFKRADLAMYQAKAAGRNALRFYDPVKQASVAARLALESELRRAIDSQEFSLYYQPQVDTAGRCIGVEALIRWHNRERGMVSPGDFIPLAEESGLIVAIGHWVLREACAQLIAWQADPATAGLSVAINVSAKQFRRADFVDEVRAAVAAAGIDPALLKLEITESLLLEDLDQIVAKMAALRQHGISFSLDDFGTGYSSLTYLKRLPLQQVKIDRSFVRDILVDPNDAAICRAIIALGKSLGLAIIAEGVETDSQWQALAGEGCHAAQGYLYARPMPQPELRAWLAGRIAQ